MIKFLLTLTGKLLFWGLVAVSLLVLCLHQGWWWGRVDWENPAPLRGEEHSIYQMNGALIRGMDSRGIEYLPYKEMPEHLVEAFIAIEDHRFSRHRGVDVLGVMRAVWVNLTTGELVQGGSTITQQLARNLFLDHARTAERKLAEASIALQLERRYSKEEIMEMYLNQIYFGEGNWGVNQAARARFDKEAEELALGEAAYLAGLVRSPGTYSFSDPQDREWARSRQELVLQRMVELEYISEEEAQEAVFAQD